MSDEETRPASDPRRISRRRVLATSLCIAVMAALACVLVLSLTSHESREQRISSRALQAPLLESDGQTSNLKASMHSGPVLVNLWQASCRPCVDEMPLLEELHQKAVGVRVVGINSLDSAATAQGMVERTGVTYEWLRDPDGTLFYEIGATGLPYSVLVTPSGTVLGEHVGRFDSYRDIQSWVDQHLPD